MAFSFPLEKLAPELQMSRKNLSDYCDLTSIRYLVNLSATIKSFFLKYPQTYLRDIVRELPCLVGNLLCISWVINTVPQEYLEPFYILEWLGSINHVGDTMMLNRWMFVRTDSLEVLYELADAMEEIEEVVRFYTRAVLAILDAVSDSGASHSTIGLSTTEYERIASAFLLLKIHTHHRRLLGDERLFMDTLQIWQIEQMVTVKAFLQDIWRNTRSALYYLVDAKYSRWELAFNAPRFVWYLFEDFHFSRRLPSLYLTLSANRRDNLFSGYDTFWQRIRSVHMMNGDKSFGIKTLHDIDGLDVTSDPLTNYGYALLGELDADGGLSDGLYQQTFLHLGLLFWDDDRFLNTRLTSINDFDLLTERLGEALHRAHVSSYDNVYRDTVTPHLYLLRTEDILEWTRSAVQCTFGEWMMS